MSAIIKAVGVKFNNPSLPILAPMITQGLEAAWRPNNSSMGLIDLSGNGHILTKAGNPAYRIIDLGQQHQWLCYGCE